jgi:hypothetical protein
MPKLNTGHANFHKPEMGFFYLENNIINLLKDNGSGCTIQPVVLFHRCYHLIDDKYQQPYFEQEHIQSIFDLCLNVMVSGTEPLVMAICFVPLEDFKIAGT